VGQEVQGALDKNRILLIHTGGTIGMRVGRGGLIPSQGVVENAVRQMAPANVVVQIETFNPLVDSADVGPTHWNRIIDLVSSWRGAGVIVTHGTDTMAFTGAALSQALSSVPFAVVLCGSMHPLGTGSDAEANLGLALSAAQTAKPGVWLAFANQILPAAGLVKCHSTATDSFRALLPQVRDTDFKPSRFSKLRLAILSLSPGIGHEMIVAALAALDGAVLRVFGSGTIMADKAVIGALADAIGRGCRIRAVSQCEQGGLSPGAYAAGAALWNIGVENGGQETPEAALAKIWLEMSEQRA